MGKSANHTAPGADVLAIFGISGDLAKKMTFRALYKLEERGKLDCPIVGVAIDEWDDEQLRQHAPRSPSPTRTSSPGWRRGSPMSRATTPTLAPSSG
jgi:glucose-6-phosphate 1-dehydrogenase